METESGETEGMGMEETAPVEVPQQPTEEMEETAPEKASTEAPQDGPRLEGRRTQLRRVSDSLQILSNEVGRFRKSHEVSTKTLQAEVASLRREFASHTRSKESLAHTRAHEADTKRLERQITQLRSDLASLKTSMAKEAAKSRAKEEAALSKIIAKVRGSRPAKKALTKPTKKKR